MRILAVDDEAIALENLIKEIKSSNEEAEVFSFLHGDAAIAFMKEKICDVAFLDIEMPGIDGINLANELIKINPNVNIIFATEHDRYYGVAFDMHVSGYILKPITSEKIRIELENLRKPVKSSNKLRIEVFGNFEVYFDEKPIKFKYSKTKELFAYLVDRNGALCTIGEIMSILFEDDEGHKTYFKSIRKDLLETLKNLGCEECINIQYGKMGINKSNVSCNYYDYLNGKINLNEVYQGEYMTQYSFSEYTNTILYKKTN